MDLTTALTIVGTTVGFLAVFISIVVWGVGRLHEDISALSTRMDATNVRIDQLYGMFIDLLKERNKP